MSDKLLWRIYIGLVGAATTVVAQRLLTAVWKQVTGDEPPSPTDPETPLRVAATWALASGIGVGAGQLLTARMAARHFAKSGRTAPGLGKVRVNL